MTLDEIRDELARMDGWVRVRDGWEKPPTRAIWPDNPYPPTLDAAAAALPEGWDVEWTYTSVNFTGEKVWIARFEEPIGPTAEGGFEVVEVPDTGNEIYDRFRLGLEARRAMEGKA